MLSEQVKCICADHAGAVQLVIEYHPSSKSSSGTGHCCLLRDWGQVSSIQEYIVCKAAIEIAAVRPGDACSQLIMQAVFMLVSLIECLALHFCSWVGCLLVQDSILLLRR